MVAAVLKFPPGWVSGRVKPNENVIQAFEDYWTANKKEVFSKLCADKKIAPQALEKLLDNYAFANRLPRDHEIVNSLNFKPKILERKPVIERVADKIKSFIDTFVEGKGGSVSIRPCLIRKVEMAR